MRAGKSPARPHPPRAATITVQPVHDDLVDFTRDLTCTFAPLADQRRQTLIYESDLDALRIRFDPHALEKVVVNLITNALTFTPEGGRILVTVSPSRDGTCAELSVKDTGPGIAAVNLERVFAPFEQVDTSIRRAHEGRHRPDAGPGVD